MLDRTIVLGTIAACMLATTVAAQAPAPPTTAFDGTYAGVSRTLMGGMADNDPLRSCAPNGPPGPLTIAGGVPRCNGSTLRQATFEGSVNAQGVLVMHTPASERLEARIDGRGTLTGRFTGSCSYQMVWQKESKYPPRRRSMKATATSTEREKSRPRAPRRRESLGVDGRDDLLLDADRQRRARCRAGIRA